MKFVLNATTYNTLALWQSAGYDAHSCSVDPVFVNAAGSDYRIKVDSSVRRAGTNIGYTTDYVVTKIPKNRPPDVGAYQYLVREATAIKIRRRLR